MKRSDPLIVFTPSGKRGRFPVGTTVLQAARQLGVDLDSVCGGRGICSRCQIAPGFGSFPKHGIEAHPNSLSEWNAVEDRYNRIRGLKAGRRLGCQAKLHGDIVIDVPRGSQVHKQVVRKDADERPVKMDPAVRLYYLEVEEPDMHNPSGDFERLRTALAEQWDIECVEIEINALRKLQPALRKGNWTATVALHYNIQGQAPRILEVWPGFLDGSVYGVAIDLGSTTIAAHLCDLRDGRVLSSAGIMNPQIRFGEDLMSRVSYAMMNPCGDREMTNAVREALNNLISEVIGQAGVNAGQVLEIVLVCNPVMHHIVMGIDPVELGQAPFALATADSVTLTAADLDIAILSSSAQIYVLPCIAGHVGSDSAAVVLAEEPHKSDDRVLVIDVGTNAELVYGSKDRLLACSSPTGPAFEGAQISSGQRAAPGAIERVEIDRDSREPRFKVIGSNLWSDDPEFYHSIEGIGVTGICGSGIIEAIAEMRICGIVDQSGLIGSAEQAGSPRLVPDGRTFAYILFDPPERNAPPVWVTQADIRAIQLAKSALYAGAKLLMDEFGADRADRIVLAGAFGSRISTRHAMVLGMIPDCELGKVSAAGNAAGTGARIALCSNTARSEIEAVVRQIEKIETAVEPKFQEHFVNANAIPHSVDNFPELRKAVEFTDADHGKSARRGDSRGRQRQRKRSRKPSPA